MAALRNLRVATRLNALVALLVIAVTLLCSVAVVQLRDAAAAQAELRTAGDLQAHAREALGNIADVAGWQTAYAFAASTNGPAEVADAARDRATFLEVVARTRADLAEFGAFLEDQPQEWRDLHARMNAGFDEIMALDARVVALYATGRPADRDAAHLLVDVERRVPYDAALAAADTLARAIDAHQEKVHATAEAQAASAERFLVGVGLTTVLVAAGAALVVSASVRRPLVGLRDRLADIARGDADLTQRLPVTGRDELTDVSGLFNEFVEGIAGCVREVHRSASSLAAAAEQLAATSGSIAASSSAAATRAGRVADASHTVEANVGAFSVAADELGASIGEIAQSATQAAHVASEAVTLAERTTRTIERLGLSSAEIGGVVALIRGVAEQTNLLALNATIEAARAGEAGRGFAVVATEVKELAGETARATEDISSRVEQIQAETERAVAAIGEIAHVIAQVNDYQASIAGAVEEQTATAGEMSRTVRAAAEGTRDITSNIGGVAEAARSTDESLVEARSATADLARMSARLQDVVGRFTV